MRNEEDENVCEVCGGESAEYPEAEPIVCEGCRETAMDHGILV